MLKWYIVSRMTIRRDADGGVLVHYGSSVLRAASPEEAQDIKMADMVKKHPRTDGWTNHSTMVEEITPAGVALMALDYGLLEH